MNDTSRASGTETQVVQSYGVESLVGEFPAIESLREYIFHHREGSTSVMKELRRFPAEAKPPDPWVTIPKDHVSKYFGKNAARVLEALSDHSYIAVQNEDYFVTERFLAASPDEFDSGLGENANQEVYQRLDKIVWKPLPDDGGKTGIAAIVDRCAEPEKAAIRRTDLEWWFLTGNGITGFHFNAPPRDELLAFLDLRLQLIHQERLQNYFHVLSTFNADGAMWMDAEDKKALFFEIVQNHLVHTWRPFDLEECAVSIIARGGTDSFATGTLSVEFAENGEIASRFSPESFHFEYPRNPQREFTFNDVQLTGGGFNGGAAIMGLRMKSRSCGNVDPRKNMLTHRFIKLFIESVGKLIDVILPVIHREEAEQDLRWRDYLDTLRLRALETGENIHKILTDSLRPLKRFFAVEKIWIFSEDDDLLHMLRLFARADEKEPLYKIVDAPLAPEAILRSQLIPFPVREIQAGRVILYLSLPLVGTKPDDPGDAEQFLRGTEIYEGIREDASVYGMTELKDIVFFLVTECLTANPKAVLTNLARRWPVRKGQGNLEVMLRVTRRILKRYSRFFDLFQTLSSNLEAALSFLRSRRDRLTGLYNRQSFQTILEGKYTRPGYPFGLMFIDMDNFKIFNDAISHHFGDKILTALSDRLIRASELIVDESIPGRFGGDEFCFAVGGVEKEELEGIAVRVFTSITNEPLDVGFYIEDRPESSMLEVNLISFLHRCMRPDVGSRQASLSEFVERPHRSPRGHVLDIYVHYRQLRGDSLGDLSEIILSEKIDSKTAGMIVNEISEIIVDKIVWNKILPEVDKTFRSIIRAFVALQLKNQTTDKIREKIISSIGKVVLEREITLKVSAGLAHSREHRLRSVSSLFKAADNRAYLAKQNGRNCLFGVDGQRLI